MNAADATLVLAAAAMIDNRTVAESQARMWARILDPNLTVEDAIEAVADHYANTRDWIMPADINTRGQAIRHRRLGREAREAYIARELANNPGITRAEIDIDQTTALTGGPAPDVAAELVLPPSPPRVHPRELMSQHVHDARRAELEAGTQAKAAHDAGRAVAEAELEQARAAAATADRATPPNDPETPSEATG